MLPAAATYQRSKRGERAVWLHTVVSRYIWYRQTNLPSYKYVGRREDTRFRSQPRYATDRRKPIIVAYAKKTPSSSNDIRSIYTAARCRCQVRFSVYMLPCFFMTTTTAYFVLQQYIHTLYIQNYTPRTTRDRSITPTSLSQDEFRGKKNRSHS